MRFLYFSDILCVHTTQKQINFQTSYMAIVLRNIIECKLEESDWGKVLSCLKCFSREDLEELPY